MALFRRRAPRKAAAPVERSQINEHLANFASSRLGVEAYIEPATNITPTTVLLIATTGEWTRRPVASPAAARQLAAKLGLPVYDVNFTGYPPRMRQWDQANRGRVAPPPG
ncbi:MAG: oxidoreductase [Bifidobacteriaceae bacterium]|jgi:hypothetical protein|nr:oxidoreductase [Bifidobacteriaceae bacterium]